MIIDILSLWWRVVNNDLFFLFGFMSYNEYREIILNGYVFYFNGMVVLFGVFYVLFVKGKDFIF